MNVSKQALKMNEIQTMRFLDLYEKERLLWDTTEKQYVDRATRIAATKRISSAMGLRDFTFPYVLIKFKNLRSSYMQELKKIDKSKNFGDTTLYKPQVFWFNKMDSFLRPFIGAPKKSKLNTASHKTTKYQNTTKYLEIHHNTDDTMDYYDPPVVEYAENFESDNAKAHADVIQEIPNKTNITKRVAIGNLLETSPKKQRLNIANNADNNFPQNLNPPSNGVRPEDSFEFFGRYMASVLRDLPRVTACLLQQRMTAMAMQAMMELPGNDVNHGNMIYDQESTEDGYILDCKDAKEEYILN